MFLMSQRFCKNVGPVKVGVDFDMFDVALFDLVIEMMSFYGNVFRPGFVTFTIGNDNTGSIVFKYHGCR